jgi:hypothetical protein
MTKIDPSSALLAQLRAEALAWRRRAGARDETSAVEQRAKSITGRAPDWLAQVAQAVAAIDQGDPQRRRKAFRIYLQAVLARDCGVRQVDDPAFQTLVDRVRDAMECDDRLRDAMATAGEMLVQSAG